LPVDWFTTVKVASAATDLRRYDESRRTPRLPAAAGVPSRADNEPASGRLAETLRGSRRRADDFYQGEIARSIAAPERPAGALSAEDLAGIERIIPARHPRGMCYRGTRDDRGADLARVLGNGCRARFTAAAPAISKR
jgi:gamma-glutamyltranspeptidase/glutathione hydrolase